MSDGEMRDIILEAVLTVTEVKTMWKIDQKTVMMAIYQEKLAARQATGGKTWLITRASCIRTWGEPKIKELE